MATTGPDDPLRTNVEQWLRAFVTAGMAVPVAAAAGVRRCLGGRLGGVTHRVAEPVRLVRSIVELATGATPAQVEDASPSAPPPADETAEPERDTSADAAAAQQLPIDEYESLAASHVVAKLSNLTPAELRRVRRFEVAHRGRRTVIGRIDQLLGDAAPS
jgi:hypothetical protein